MTGTLSGSLPAGMVSDDTDEAIAILSRSEDDSDGPRKEGVSPSRNARLARIASGEQAVPHLIATIRFGRLDDPARWTTCTACDFTATGTTDKEMSEAWRLHVAASVGARHGRRGRHPKSGPVEVVLPE